MLASKLDMDLCIPGKADRVDYRLLQACLNVYQPEVNREEPTVAILTLFLKAFGFNEEKLVEYLNINGDRGGNRISKSDFVFLAKKRLGSTKFSDVGHG